MRGTCKWCTRPFSPGLFLVFFKPFPAADHFALWRRPGPDTTSFGAAVKIIITYFGAGHRYQATDAYLAFQFLPEKYKAGPGVFQELLPFDTMIVGEKGVTVLVKAFQKHNTTIGHP